MLDALIARLNELIIIIIIIIIMIIIIMFDALIARLNELIATSSGSPVTCALLTCMRIDMGV